MQILSAPPRPAPSEAAEAGPDPERFNKPSRCPGGAGGGRQERKRLEGNASSSRLSGRFPVRAPGPPSSRPRAAPVRPPARCPGAPLPGARPGPLLSRGRAMQRRSTRSAADRAAAALLRGGWGATGAALEPARPSRLRRPSQAVSSPRRSGRAPSGRRRGSRAICLGEKAKEGMNLVEILPPANQEDKKSKPITTASLQASVLPMAVTMGFEISPPVTFQLQAGSGPVVLSGQEYHWRPEGAPRRWQVNTSAPVLGRLRSLLGRGEGGGCVPGGGEPLRTSQEAGAPEADQRRREEKGGRRGGGSKTQS
nr:nucleoplasmin-2 [Manis javanica]